MKKITLSLIGILMAIIIITPSCKKNGTESVKEEKIKLKSKLSTVPPVFLPPPIVTMSTAIATESEYNQATPVEKELILQVQLAYDALNNYVDPIEGGNYEATFIYNSGSPSTSRINIFNGPETYTNTPKLTCNVCGTVSAVRCINRIREYMDQNNKSSISISVKRVGECVNIIYGSVKGDLIPEEGNQPNPGETPTTPGEVTPEPEEDPLYVSSVPGCPMLPVPKWHPTVPIQ